MRGDAEAGYCEPSGKRIETVELGARPGRRCAKVCGPRNANREDDREVDVELTSTRNGASARVEVIGDLDSETSASLETEVASLIAAGVDDLEFDVAGVTFLSSAGLTVLIHAHGEVRRVRVNRGNRLVDRLIDLTGLSMLYGDAV